MHLAEIMFNTSSKHVGIFVVSLWQKNISIKNWGDTFDNMKYEESSQPCDKWNKTKIIMYILKYVCVCLDMIASYLEDVKY